MKTNPANAPLHLDVYADPAEFVGPTVTATPHLADHYRAVVMTNRIGRINEVNAWYAHGDDQRALHAMNLMSDEELAMAAVVAEKVLSMASEIIGDRRAVGDEIEVLVVGAGRRRAL